MPLAHSYFRRLSYLACAVYLLMLTGCTVFGSISESMFLMSPQDEQQLGAKLAAQMRPKQVFITDPAVDHYVLDVCNRVWQNSPPSELPARFHVIQDATINAYAIPGGDVYIQSGLINAASDEAELAAVIAHECGHVIRRHAARQASHQTGANVMLEILTGASPEGGQALAQMASSIVAQGGLATFSRADESEADAIAVGTLYRAGYDPNALRTFFVKIEQKYGDTNGRVEQFFASHPPTSARMDAVTQMVEQLPRNAARRPIEGLRETQARLRALGIQ